MRRLYRKLVRVAQASLDHAQQVLTLLTGRAGSLKAVALRATLAQFMSLLQRVIDQTTRRVLEGQSVPAPQKVVSLFEPHTAIIQRGKAPPRDTEFGRKVGYAEVDGGLISEYRLLPGNPPRQSRPMGDQFEASSSTLWASAHHRHGRPGRAFPSSRRGRPTRTD